MACKKNINTGTTFEAGGGKPLDGVIFSSLRVGDWFLNGTHVCFKNNMGGFIDMSAEEAIYVDDGDTLDDDTFTPLGKAIISFPNYHGLKNFAPFLVD